MDDVVKEFLEASSFMTAVRTSFDNQFAQIPKDLPDIERVWFDKFNQNRDLLLAEVEKVVISKFTKEEMVLLIDFYRNHPIGKLVKEKMPDLGAELSGLLYHFVAKCTDDVGLDVFDRFIEH